MLFRRNNPHEYERELRHSAAAWPEHRTLDTLTVEALRQVTALKGVDFATALLFDRFQTSPVRSKFIKRIDALRGSPASAPPGIDARIIIVPGALYLERPDMGGDGRIIREVAAAFGLETELIPLASFGSVEHNAGIIRRWLEQNQKERIILVSLSKGGSDLKFALLKPKPFALSPNVIAWINVCGPLEGSRMANWILESRLRMLFFRSKFKWQERDFQFVTDLNHGRNTPLSFGLRLPAQVKMLSLIGFPLRQHMTTGFSRFCHSTIAKSGPNDGTTLLADLQNLPGEIYPAWGMDHYFRPESEGRSLVAATLRYLAEAGLPLGA